MAATLSPSWSGRSFFNASSIFRARDRCFSAFVSWQLFYHSYLLLQIRLGFGIVGLAGKWRNWYTRTTQNRMVVTPRGFDSLLAHHPPTPRLRRAFGPNETWTVGGVPLEALPPYAEGYRWPPIALATGGRSGAAPG